MTRFLVVDATPYGPEPSGARRRTEALLARLPARRPADVFEVHWARDGGGPPPGLVADRVVHAQVGASCRGGALRWFARARALAQRHREAPFSHLLVDHGPLVAPDRVANVVTVHDLRFLHGWSGRWRAWYGRHRYGDLLARAALVVAVSNAVAEELERAYGLREVLVAPNAPGSAFRPTARAATTEVLARHGVSAPYVLVVGRDEPRKALPAACGAAHAAGIAWVWVGGSRRAAFDGHALGVLADEDLAALYAGAAWTLVPSLYEGYSLPVAESLAVGTPVVASDLAAHRALLGDGAVGLVLVPPPAGPRASPWPEAADVLRGPRPLEVAPPHTTWDDVAERLARAIP